MLINLLQELINLSCWQDGEIVYTNSERALEIRGKIVNEKTSLREKLGYSAYTNHMSNIYNELDYTELGYI